jgi:predicted phosphodiesterase
MRVAILSDIHGNRTAFEAVLSDVRDVSPDIVFHGGDLADGGSSPVEIIDYIRDLEWPGVVGNTDQMLAQPEIFEAFAAGRPQLNAIWEATRRAANVTREWLGEDRLDWLRSLPSRQTQEFVALVHARPETAWNSPMPSASDDELESIYSPLNRPFAAYGHIHLPYIRKTSKLTVANAGSVGMPFDGDRRASYLLVDGVHATLRRVEYDVDSEIHNLRSCGIPHAEWIANILSTAQPKMP